MHGQDEHLGAGQRLADLARGFQAVQLRHAEVEHHHVRFQCPRLRDGLAAGGGFAADPEIRARR